MFIYSFLFILTILFLFCFYLKYDIYNHFKEEKGINLINLIILYKENGHKPNSPYRFGYREKVEYYGFRFEEHKITTEDGYILTAWRILKKENNNLNLKKRAVMLNHGLLDSAYTFLAFEERNCLPFILADKK